MLLSHSMDCLDEVYGNEVLIARIRAPHSAPRAQSPHHFVSPAQPRDHVSLLAKPSRGD